MAREIVWDKQALAYLADAIAWISEQSIQQAALVEEAILKKIEESAEHPEKHPMDKPCLPRCPLAPTCSGCLLSKQT
jgi:plasmid stabilization system protein ParE